MARHSKKNLTRPHRKKKTLKRGAVNLKSGLEAYCFDRLKEAKLNFDYEEETFQLMEGFRYTGTYHKSTKGKDVLIDATGKAVLGIKYTPDFVSHERKFVIETKGYVPSQHTFPLRWKLFLRYMIENGMEDYMLFIPKNKKQVDAAVSIIKNHTHG